MSKSNVDLCEPTSAPDLAGMATSPRPRMKLVKRRDDRVIVELACTCGNVEQFTRSLVSNALLCYECRRDFMADQLDYGVPDERLSPLRSIAERATRAYEILRAASPAQPRNTAPQSVAGSDGPTLTEPTARTSLPGDDHSAAPIIHYSCGCNRVRRFAASPDTCTTCHKPLSIRYDNNRPVDPNIQVKWIAMLVADTITRLRGIIDDHRPHLSLADVSSALRTIDEARGMIRLHDLGETPLVMPRNYGERPAYSSRPSTLSPPNSPLSVPEGT